jgi:predicted phage tail protein
MRDSKNEVALVSPRGAGGLLGGGGGGSTPPSNSMQSVAFATMLDLICEGEIQGLVNGLQGIYLNGIPVQETNGTNNFIGATIAWTNGTQTQDYLPGFGSVNATATLGTQVYNSVPVSSQIDNPEADAVIITLSVGGLSNTDSSGDISGTTVELQVSFQPTNGPVVQALTATFDGYTSSRYERSYRFPLSGTGPWTVTVTRVTPDSQNVSLVNPTFVDAVTTVVDTKLAYPNSALVGFQIDARQFASIPERSYLIQGLLIQVPNNYDPANRIYTGTWDGGFQIAYSNNPAWCLYDLLTSDRYGLGLYINDAEIDTAALYEIAQYCDELVPDGFGGQEPRFQLNTCISSAKAAYDLVQDLCSVFRGMTYWGAGTVLTTQDAPWQGPMPLFSPANVVGGQFTYAGSQRKDRHTVAYVTYNDPNQQYVQATEYVEDPDGIARYGVRPISIMAVGCTTRGQAYRLGMWQLYSERLDTDQVQFTAGLDAAQLTPGTVIQIADPVRAGERMGGRILSGSTTSGIVLDSPVTLDAGQTYTLYFMDTNGVQQSVGIVNTVETTSELVFTTPTATAPNTGFMWTLSGSNLNTQLFRVVNVQESAQNAFDVLAITYNESKFNGVDFGTALSIPPTSLTLSLVSILPTSWSITPATYLSSPGVLAQKLIMSWSGNSAQYLFQWRVNGGPWQSTNLKTPANVIAPVTALDVYDFQVYGLSVDGTTSQPLVETFTVPKIGAPPGAPTDLTAAGSIKAVVLNWAAPDNLDLDYFQVFQSTTNILTNAVLVGDNIGATNWTAGGLISGDTYYYWVRAVNTSGAIGPYNSNIGTAATTLYVQPGDFNLGTILYDISTAQEINGALIANATITQANIAAQAVGTAQIQAAAVTTGLLANQAVENANIAAAAIATGNIQSGAVTSTAIANAAIGSAAIQNGAITTALIGTGQITNAQIAGATITTANIEAAAITTALIQTAAIGTAQIENAAITSALIANAAVGTAQIQQAGITSANIGTAQINTLHLVNGSVTSMVTASGTSSASFTYASTGYPVLIIASGLTFGTGTITSNGTTLASNSNTSGSSGSNVTPVWSGVLGTGNFTLSANGFDGCSLTVFEARR